MKKPGIFYGIGEAINNLFGYGRIIGTGLNSGAAIKEERALDAVLAGYPRNHNYRLRGGAVVPSYRLFCRERLVTSLFQPKMESFLDIGCCRGYYVLKAAEGEHCRLAAGIDVFEPFVSISKQVRKCLAVENANFHLAAIDEVAESLKEFGGPFQTVMTIGTYHYLFWGSSRSENAFYDHRRILSILSDLCTERLIFSGRLELERLPEEIADKARGHEKADTYNTADFLKVASEFFDVKEAGFLGTYPLYLMEKK